MEGGTSSGMIVDVAVGETGDGASVGFSVGGTAGSGGSVGSIGVGTF